MRKERFVDTWASYAGVGADVSQIGSIKYRIYATYLKYSGGWLVWTPAVFTYAMNLAMSLGRVSNQRISTIRKPC